MELGIGRNIFGLSLKCLSVVSVVLGLVKPS